MTKGTKIAIGIGASAILALVLFLILRRKNDSCSVGQMSGNGYISKKGADGELCQSFLGIKNAPRGVRNNNPGNEKLTNTSWKGKISNSKNTDGTFEQFESWAYGIRCMIYELDRNYISKGYNTIRKLISRYDNPSATHYMDYVSARLNVGKDSILTNDKTTLRKLVQAMSKLENDSDHPTEIVTNEQFEMGWKLYKE